MEKTEIIRQLTEKHAAFSQYIGTLSESDYLFAPPGKWNAGQQMDHILRSISPLIMAFRLPKFVLRLLFGVPNRPSKSYEALVKKYTDRLENGGRATGQFVPKFVDYAAQNKQTEKIQSLITKLCAMVDRCAEDDLDKYLLPHPLLGKLTLREMLYFTAYHVEHHHNIAIRSLRQQI